MDIRKELELAKKDFVDNGNNYETLVAYLADKKTYHTLATMIFSIITDLDEVSCKKHIYSHSYFQDFEIENNPLNEDFIKA